ncbi:HET-domain-containing protein [Microthyrium microscopicum]|uniref:HET-domain-containing protein n=1 Tax=Microthyrium microscopicum TaxID=703497 RepID=A0A6A6U6A4_9PEZI|nr:HET-domain-containing protein [Microthyrium microscopicum]
MLTSSGDLAAEYVRGRSVVRRKNLYTYERIRNWLEDCDSSHDCCERQAVGSNIRPTFLLDLSRTRNSRHLIKLHRVKDEDLKYAALSYCWGQEQPLACSTANIDVYLTQIEVVTLPKSIRDAIWVTRRLNLRFLWVDSLCVLQDDEYAKIHEIGRMEHIYSNAHVTISADCALNCMTGFLSVRRPFYKPISLPFRTPNNTVGNIKLISVEQPGRLPQDNESHEKQPIHSRAWTFQESFMSRRIVIYSEYKIFWVCARASSTDGGNQTYVNYSTPTSTGLNVQVFSRRTLLSPTYSDWCQVVEEFCRRKLTNPEDKLAALSSVAGYFANSLNDKYLAGLWESALPKQLYWHTTDEASTSPRRPPAWRSPSWSPMSVDSAISFAQDQSGHRKYAEEPDNIAFCTVLDSDVAPVHSDAPYGPVVSGSIELRCRALKMHTPEPIQGNGRAYGYVDDEHAQTKFVLKYDTFEYNELDSTATSTLHLRVNTSYGVLEPKADLWCLMLFTEVDDWNCENVFGLVLAKLPDDNYHRVGTFFGQPAAVELFHAQQYQDVTIV